MYCSSSSRGSDSRAGHSSDSHIIQVTLQSDSKTCDSLRDFIKSLPGLPSKLDDARVRSLTDMLQPIKVTQALSFTNEWLQALTVVNGLCEQMKEQGVANSELQLSLLQKLAQSSDQSNPSVHAHVHVPVSGFIGISANVTDINLHMHTSEATINLNAVNPVPMPETDGFKPWVVCLTDQQLNTAYLASLVLGLDFDTTDGWEDAVRERTISRVPEQYRHLFEYEKFINDVMEQDAVE